MEGLLTLTEASQLTGLGIAKIKKNPLIKKKLVNGKILFCEEDLEKIRQELEYRKKIRINHIPFKKKIIEVDREKYVTAYNLHQITNLNPVTIHQLLQKGKIKFDNWNDAKFFPKKEAMEIVNRYLEYKKNKKDKKDGTKQSSDK